MKLAALLMAAIVLGALSPTVQAQSFESKKSCLQSSGISPEDLGQVAENLEVVVSPLVNGTATEDDAEFTLSKCTYFRDDTTLAFHGTYVVQQTSNGFPAAFDCIAFLNDQECSSCDTCSFVDDPIVVEDIFMFYDCSNVEEGCSANNNEGCSNQVGDQSFEQCFAEPTLEPSAAPASAAPAPAPPTSDAISESTQHMLLKGCGLAALVVAALS